MKLGRLVLGVAAGAALAARKIYQRGKLAGVAAGLEIGRQKHFADGLARGIVISSAAFAGTSLQRPILEDRTLGGRLEERMRGAAARKPS